MTVFQQNILTLYGERGKKWLNELPSILATSIEKYGLSQLEPVSNMSFNFVARGYLSNKPIIVKLGLNSHALLMEAQCLKAFKDHGCPDVIVNTDNLIIMDCAEPGTTLKKYFPFQDNEATSIVCHVVKNLHAAHIPANHCFCHVHELLTALDKEIDIPNVILKKARELRDKLLDSTTKEVLLHGDLHHDNLLKRGSEWIAIDPKGFIGDPVFELAAFLCNPIPELLQERNPKEILIERIKSCATHFNLTEQRIYDWLYVKSVLCWAWSLEDKLEPTYWQQLLYVLVSTRSYIHS